ncbi:MAG: hypothetical protein LBD07_04045 [Spirochaetaceae bacterium]|nr:hypothetical protein [Spirochaetaceae bacterium]
MKKYFLFLFCFIGFSLYCFAQDSGVSVVIRFYDKKVYYAENDPIFILVTIANSSPSVYRFRISDDRAFFVDFDARTPANRPLEQADVLERRRSTSSQIFYRDVSLEAGESFSFIENLRDYVKINTPGSFIVQAKVYPELLDIAKRQTVSLGLNSGGNMMSNRLPLQIKPKAVIGADGLAVALDVETGAIIAREKISPDQIVTWTLRARQKSEWEKFFLYFDIEKMLMRSGSRQRQWRAESEEGRQRMVATYRTELQKSLTDSDLSAIPMYFEIENTNYNMEEGKVIALEKFKTGDYIERKRYTYYLEKKDDYWTIIDYTVMNLGTE